MYSNPPLHGARLVSTVFTVPELRAQWNKDVKTMADRIIGSRKALVDNLARIGSKRDWSHITNQIGMFAYSGLSGTLLRRLGISRPCTLAQSLTHWSCGGAEPEVRKLRDLHVYMNLDGRMSISGINSGNVQYLAEAMHKATSS